MCNKKFCSAWEIQIVGSRRFLESSRIFSFPFETRKQKVSVNTKPVKFLKILIVSWI